MKRPLFLLFFIGLAAGIYAQEKVSFKSKSESVLDSLNELSNKKWVTDSLSILAWGDSVRTNVTGKSSERIAAINHKIDSLNQLQLPTNHLKNKIDSINQKKDQLIGTVNNKQQELLGGTKKKVTDWQSKIKSKLGLNMSDVNSATTDMGGKPVGDLKVGSGQLAVGSILPINSEAPDNIRETIDNLNLNTEDLKIPSLESMDFKNLDLPTDLQSINQSLPFTKIDGLQEWQGKISDVTGQASVLKDMKSNPDKVLENAATNISQVGDAKKVLGTNAFDQSEYGAILKNANDEEAMKKMLTNQVKKEALNHFAGKEQVLQSAMEQVAKYKKTYSSVNSLSDIKKLSKNPLKGKPFRERFIPGVTLQIHVKNYLNFDVNPYGRYLITDKISLGVGWNQRWALDWDNKSWVAGARVFGPRVFGEFKLKRGFSIRVEEEAMNMAVPPYYLSPGESKREWIFTTMTGLKKEYRFIKNVKGFTIVNFDVVKLFVPNHHSPYGDVVNARLGFEFPMKKRPVKNKSQSENLSH